jgi:hypothetical protein
MIKREDSIKLIKDHCLLNENISSLIIDIDQMDNKDQYKLEIGRDLYSKGKKINANTVTIYGIFIDEDMSFHYQTALCYGDEILSKEYSSQFEPKIPIPIMNGYIFTVWGEFIESEKKILVKKSDLMRWPTEIPLSELKKRVQWFSSPIFYKGYTVPIHINELPDMEGENFQEYHGTTFTGATIAKGKNKIEVSNLGRIKIDDTIIPQKYDSEKKLLYIPGHIYVHKLVGETFLEKPNGLNTEIHHIDNNGYNNNKENLIGLTPEQHASIHLWMWKNFKNK